MRGIKNSASLIFLAIMLVIFATLTASTAVAKCENATLDNLTCLMGKTITPTAANIAALVLIIVAIYTTLKSAL
ncbi:MAG: hypothetical protein QXT27_01670 [Pyrobaculum sp.]